MDNINYYHSCDKLFIVQEVKERIKISYLLIIMNPIIEIVSRNIVYNNKYNQKFKDEYVATINRIGSIKTDMLQRYRSADYVILYNRLHEEIIYLTQQKKYFSEVLDNDVNEIIQEYFDSRINLYDDHIRKMEILK
jgi:hypothetical protein